MEVRYEREERGEDRECRGIAGEVCNGRLGTLSGFCFGANRCRERPGDDATVTACGFPMEEDAFHVMGWTRNRGSLTTCFEFAMVDLSIWA